MAAQRQALEFGGQTAAPAAILVGANAVLAAIYATQKEGVCVGQREGN